MLLQLQRCFPLFQIHQTILRRILIQTCQGWIIIDCLNEGIDRAVCDHHMRTDVDQLGSLFANDMHTEQFLILGGENEFDHPAHIADDLSAWIILKVAASDHVRKLFRRTFVLGDTHHRNLGDGING